MCNFYSNYCKLCSEANVSLTKVSLDIGLSNAAPSGWKKGKVPTDVNLQKIASYFTEKLGRPITVQYLKSDDGQTVDDQYKDVPEDVKTLAAAVALAKKMQEKSSPAKKADELTKDDVEKWIKTEATDEELIQFIAAASAKLVKK